MIAPGTWSRRRFSQTLALAAFSAALPQRSLASSQSCADGFAFVATNPTSGVGALCSVKVDRSGWHIVQSTPSDSVAHLEAHPTLPFLYAVHDVALWDHRPRGAVSSYSVEVGTGSLRLVSTQPLSLGATHPKHAAVIAEGTQLAVAAQGGGIYNILPLAPDGSIQPPVIVRKEVGRQDGAVTKTSAPRQVAQAFHQGMLLAADPGQETITAYTLLPGSLEVRFRARVHNGAGPSHVLSHPSGRWIYTIHASNGSISAHHLQQGALSPPFQTVAPHTKTQGTAVMHPLGHLLIAANGNMLQSLRADRHTGRLSPVDSIALREPMHLIQLTRQGHLLGIHQHSGQIAEFVVDIASGHFEEQSTVATIPGARTLLFRPT